MAKKKTGLGRGLDAIFLDNTTDEVQSGVIMARISDVEPRASQPRKQFDAASLQSLAESIAANGIIQPIVVRPNMTGSYSIIAGERRWRAAKLAGLTEVPVVVTEADDLRAMQLALIENIQREDLSPLEEAAAYRRLLDEFGMTQEQLSKSVGRSRPAIANSMRLLDLPEEVRVYINSRELSEGHGRALLGLTERADILPAAERVIREGLSVRRTEELVKRLNASHITADEEPEETESGTKVDYCADLSRRLTDRMGRRVIVKEKGKSRTVTIEYEDNEDLDALIKILIGGELDD